MARTILCLRLKIESLFDSIFVPDFTFPDEVPELCLRYRMKTGCEIRFKRSKRRNVEKVVTIRVFLAKGG